MAIRVLVGIACVAIIAVSAVWIDDRFGLIDRLTYQEPTIEELTTCMRLAREQLLLSESGANPARLEALQSQYDAQCERGR